MWRSAYRWGKCALAPIIGAAALVTTTSTTSATTVPDTRPTTANFVVTGQVSLTPGTDAPESSEAALYLTVNSPIRERNDVHSACHRATDSTTCSTGAARLRSTIHTSHTPIAIRIIRSWEIRHEQEGIIGKPTTIDLVHAKHFLSSYSLTRSCSLVRTEYF